MAIERDPQVIGTCVQVPIAEKIHNALKVNEQNWNNILDRIRAVRMAFVGNTPEREPLEIKTEPGDGFLVETLNTLLGADNLSIRIKDELVQLEISLGLSPTPDKIPVYPPSKTERRR